MKFRIEVDNDSYVLEIGRDSAYSLQGVREISGRASVAAVMPGVFSILLDSRSVTVCVAPNGEDAFEVWAGNQCRIISVADVRDRSGKPKNLGAAGPVELRAQMPGKIIKILVESGEAVEAGQGVLVVEAMKMQNEVKSPKDGVVSRIFAIEGETIAPGEALAVVE